MPRQKCLYMFNNTINHIFCIYFGNIFYYKNISDSIMGFDLILTVHQQSACIFGLCCPT